MLVVNAIDRDGGCGREETGAFPWLVLGRASGARQMAVGPGKAVNLSSGLSRGPRRVGLRRPKLQSSEFAGAATPSRPA